MGTCYVADPSEFVQLSCWAWHVGAPADRFDFGAHDFRGSSTNILQETVQAEVASNVDDGLLHNVVVVVTQTSLSFYTDAKLQSEIPL